MNTGDPRSPSRGTFTSNPVIAIVGRQNVGKSTLINRLAGRRQAIVEDIPGTTRDRLETDIDIQGRTYSVIDTGGLETEKRTVLAPEINRQIRFAIEEADIILLVVDASQGLMPTDIDISGMLRPANKPLILVANKADTPKLAMNIGEFYQLGMGEPIPISAYHGRNINNLLDSILAISISKTETAEAVETTRIALVGRPNVGKSLLLNDLLGEERVVVSPLPGTTRDAIDTSIDFEGRSVILIDTAGIKKRGRIGSGIDRYSVDRSLRAIERSDVVFLVLDATEPVTEQDLHIAGYIQQAYKGIIIVVNKQDLVENLNKEELISFVRGRLKFFNHAPVVFTSAKTGFGIEGMLPAALKVAGERRKRIATADLNSAVSRAVTRHLPPSKGGRTLKFMYATQAEVSPPTFVFFVNDARLIHFSYHRFLENALRRQFGFAGTPLKFVFKSRGENK
jgi:GTP-binding protein